MNSNKYVKENNSEEQKKIEVPPLPPGSPSTQEKILEVSCKTIKPLPEDVPVNTNANTNTNTNQVKKRKIEDSQITDQNNADIKEEEKKKKRKTTEQLEKSQKYDVLKAFFRVYFREDKDSQTEKELIYALYTKKIKQESVVARNAMFRLMWSIFKKDNLSSRKINYREHIVGIKMLTEPLDQPNQIDIDLLEQHGVTTLFDFTLPELQKLAQDNTQQKELENNNINGTNTTIDIAPVKQFGVASEYLDDSSDVLQYIDDLTNTAQNLVKALTELKQKLGKK